MGGIHITKERVGKDYINSLSKAFLHIGNKAWSKFGLKWFFFFFFSEPEGAGRVFFLLPGVGFIIFQVQLGETHIAVGQHFERMNNIHSASQ